MPDASGTAQGVDARPNRRRRRRWFAAARVVALLSAVVVAFVGCSGGGSGKAKSAKTPTATTLAPGYTLAAQVKGPQIGIYDDPSAPAPSKTLPNPWLLNGEADKQIPQVFLVERQRKDGWVKVLLAERPNGSTGWVHASDVQLTPNPYHLKVSLGDHKIAVFQGTKSTYEGPVAIGAADTPTPPGKYYTRVLIQAPDPNTVYGPFAYGLSAHSDVLTEYNGGDAEVGVHGNNDSSVLGKSVTHGCIRMDNDQIVKLSKVLPLGTPVEIVS
ncbi:MAG TPA: L,D-transpeptidase [Acidimicrobiia bacterium]|nr:L,D-transpeptidase [Acidimicrobiia bacterium]